MKDYHYDRSKVNKNKRLKILLIDEVDVFFSKEFYGNVYMPQAEIREAKVKSLTDYIWRTRASNLKLKDI
jgi:hypothetical protein